MAELMPCPFCGSEAKYVISDHVNSDTTRWHKIMCKDVFGCGAELGDALSGYSPDYEDQVQKLKDKWNRRVVNILLGLTPFIPIISRDDVRPVEWIPVTDRLPDAEPGDVSERVLVTDGKDVAIVEWFNFEECGPFWGYTGFGKDVTHWMPLPAPPEGGEV